MYCKGKTVLNRTILNVELCNTVLKITRSVDLFVVYRGAQRSDAMSENRSQPHENPRQPQYTLCTRLLYYYSV